MITTIPVGLGARAYDVVVGTGLIDRAGEHIAPLLKNRDPMDVLREHAAARYPAYGEAHLTVETGDTAHGVAVEAVIQALKSHLEGHLQPSESETQ